MTLQAVRHVFWYSVVERSHCAETRTRPYSGSLVARGWILYGGPFGAEPIQWGTNTEIAP